MIEAFFIGTAFGLVLGSAATVLVVAQKDGL